MYIYIYIYIFFFSIRPARNRVYDPAPTAPSTLTPVREAHKFSPTMKNLTASCQYGSSQS